MWHLTLRDVVAHRGRFALTLLAVVLAVTFLSGSLVLTDTSGRLLDEQFADAAAGVDVTVRGAAAFDSAMGVEVERDPLPEPIVEQVRSVPGVADVVPVAQGRGLLEVDGRPVVPAGSSVLSSFAPEPVGPFSLREGRPPATAGEVALDVATARDAGLAPGDTVDVRTGGTTRLTVVGLVGFGEADGMPGATVALVTLAEAQRMLEMPAAVSELLVTTTAGTDVAEVVADLQSVLGDDVAVASAQDTAAASAAAARDQLGSVGLVLSAMSAAALVVGGLLIANTFAIVTSQRRREIALVRAAGATAGQVTRSVLVEALLLGVLGAVVGTGAGVLVAEALRALAAGLGVAVPDGRAVPSAATLGASLAIGVLVTVVSAVGAARTAARVAPVEALRASVDLVRDAPVGRARTAVRAVPLVLAAAAVVGVLAGGPIALVLLAALGVVVGIRLLAPTLTPPLARVVGAPLLRAGMPGRLARESAARAPRRTTSTATALALGLALVAFMSVVGTSLREGLTGTYRETVTADLVLESSRAEMLGGLAPHVAEVVSELPEVAAISRIRYGHWLDEGRTSALSAVDPGTLAEVTDLDLTAGSLDGLRGGGVVVAGSVAEERGLGVGDAVTMTFSRTGDRSLRVVGVLDPVDAQALSTSWLVSHETYAANFTEDVDASVLVRLADGVDAAQGQAAVERALADHPTVAVRDQAGAAAARGAAVDQVLGLVTLLLALTVGIALLGITNTLALSVAERTREIGLLRAVGATRAQVARMIRGEAALVGGIAAVLGVASGTVLAAATVVGLGSTTSLAVTVPVGRLAAVVAVAVGAGLLAGLAPARRAARMDVLDAVAAS